MKMMKTMPGKTLKTPLDKKVDRKCSKHAEMREFR
jgi:hypothetical protein